VEYNEPTGLPRHHTGKRNTEQASNSFTQPERKSSILIKKAHKIVGLFFGKNDPIFGNSDDV
jgi:hypothetical protein